MNNKTLSMLVFVFGVTLPPLRDAFLLKSDLDAEVFFSFLSVVNVISLAMGSVILARNVSEFRDIQDYLIVPSIFLVGFIVSLPLIVNNAELSYILVVFIACAASFLCSFLSHLLISSGYFMVARFAHLPQVVTSLLAILFLTLTGRLLSSEKLFLLTILGGTVAYALVFLAIRRYSEKVTETIIVFLEKPLRAGDVGRVDKLAWVALKNFVLSTTSIAMNNLGQVFFISRLDVSTYELLDVRLSFYTSSLVLMPMGYFIGRGGEGPLKKANFLLYFIVIGCSGLALVSDARLAPYLFSACIVFLRYSERALIVR